METILVKFFNPTFFELILSESIFLHWFFSLMLERTKTDLLMNDKRKSDADDKINDDTEIVDYLNSDDDSFSLPSSYSKVSLFL